MICPDCGHDNIPGVESCEACAQPLVEFDAAGSDLEQSISGHSVRVLCPKDPVSVSPVTTVREAVAKCVDGKFGCLLVEQDDELVGVFTERDVLNKLSDDLTALDRPVSDFMTAAPETLTSDDSIAYALHAMDLGGYRHMPVVNDKRKPTGIISVRDILRFLCVRFAEIRTDAN
jgi:CBS domain-containing protein